MGPVTTIQEQHTRRTKDMTIRRIDTGERMSQTVVHGNTVYTAGQVARDAPGASVTDQTKNILEAIDRLLSEAGTDNSKLLSATIWISDMSTFNEMNAVWDAWVSPGNTPARACVEARLASPDFTVEIAVIAACD
jgi:enamine deaminase RidA (YjgF/YER057c/UK114 family)|tara:strand:- start:474 stop:878 length:405 start_codon:yes stop_codon:yes gene_type:complete